MKLTAHIISHTHWDREWYINSKFTNEWLPPFFDAIFAMMEREPNYKFVLDGQMSIVDDYFAELKKCGSDIDIAKEKIGRFAKEGRLILGPYYLQPDWQLVSDEAIVRNMLIGKKLAREFGSEMKVGWLLDNFGQISQAPQIHNQFGMKGIVVWRGVELDPDNLKSEFYWESPDKTRLLCGYLLSSYRNAMRLAEHSGIIHERIKSEIKKILPFASTPNVLLMNGYDQEMIPDDILPYIRDNKADFDNINVVQSTPEDYMTALIESEPENIKILTGALNSGRYISVFPGIFSCRIYLKQQNERCQKLLERFAEPVFSLLSVYGVAYPAIALETAWKLLLKSQPHDSICGVSIDDVHTDMEKRYSQVEQLTLNELNYGLGTICANINTNIKADKAAVIFVPSVSGLPLTLNLPFKIPKGYAVKDNENILEFVSENENATVFIPKPPMAGYKTLYLEKAEHADIENGLIADKMFNTVENRYFTLKVNKNGTVNVLHKLSGKSYENIGAIQDMGDCGDEYNYSYPDNDNIINSLNTVASINWVSFNKLRAVIEITMELYVPCRIADDRTKRLEETRCLPIITTVTVERDTPYVRFNTKLKNTAKDHRVRVLFPVNIKCESSYAQTQFDVTEHPITPVMFDNSGIPDNVRRIIIGARESSPVTCFPMRRFCGMESREAGAAVIADGLPEYEVVDNKSTLALTLFRSVGWIARTDLNTRIGDAGPEIITPDAQCLRELSFDYGFYPYSGSSRQANLLGWADQFCFKPIITEVEKHDGILPASMSLVELENKDNSLQITAIKRSEDGKNIAVRLYNATDNEAAAAIKFGINVSAVCSSNLAEDVMDNLPVKDNICRLTVPAKKIVTLLATANVNYKLKSPSNVKKIVSEYSQPLIFSTYKSEELISTKVVSIEKERAEKLEKQLEILESSSCKAKEFGTDNLKEQQISAQSYQKRETVRRAALEARLSALLAEKKLEELSGSTDTEIKYEEALRDISLKLNKIRLTKRTAEYITDYYNQLVKETT